MLLRKSLLLSFLIILLFSCKKSENKDTSNWTYQVSKLKQGYLDLYLQLLAESQVSTNSMNTNISSFCTTPILPSFNQSKNSWILAYHDFQLLGPFRNANGSFNPFATSNSLFDLTNLNESYIDYVQASPSSGIIQDEVGYPSVTQSSIHSWHQLGSDDNISLGFHAIEFLLWGEDLSIAGSGARTNQDYVGSTSIVTRRKSFLRYATLDLKQTLEQIEVSNAFENQLLNLSPSAGFDYLFSGLLHFIKVDFAENAVLKPYQSQSQFDEISRFSDNTLVDFATRLEAIELFLDPRSHFTINSNYYLIDFIKEVDPSTHENLMNQLSTIKQDIFSLQVRFDVSISSSSERPKVYKLYEDLMLLYTTLSEFSKQIK